jgi:hypothetical protein
MSMRVISAALAVTFAASPVMADHKPGHTQNNPDAPGQDRVCLVTTSGGVSGTIVGTKWLPRKAAEAQANNETTFVGNSRWTQQACESFN